MIKLNPYLTFPGTAAQAIGLYKKVFKTDPEAVQKFKDMPPQEGTEVSETGAQRIVHASFRIGDDLLMLSDAPEGRDDTVQQGSQAHVSVHPESREEADRIFELLSKNGNVTMPLGMQFWGDYFGMCRDMFGVNWMVNYHEDKK